MVCSHNGPGAVSTAKWTTNVCVCVCVFVRVLEVVTGLARSRSLYRMCSRRLTFEVVPVNHSTFHSLEGVCGPDYLCPDLQPGRDLPAVLFGRSAATVVIVHAVVVAAAAVVVVAAAVVVADEKN